VRLYPVFLCVAACSLASSAAVLANGGGAMPSQPSSMAEPMRRSPAELAKAAYNSGVRSIKDAKEYDEDAIKADKDDKRTKYQGKAERAYEKALAQFMTAVQQDPDMYQAWNYVGFSLRHLGHYDESLHAYARALELKPDYPDAIEYRGEAFLALNKTDAAKAAYMDLFASSRPLADQLMAAMQRWVVARRSDAQSIEGVDVEDFQHWIDERTQIAKQTASLATGAAAPAWR
jgi:tetratricopeptide (TPR) repeat protein